jgi:TatA/E family protein of Tat protein translocase
MPDLGLPEFIIIAVIVLLLFGPGKAADLGSALGRGIREFRKATREHAPSSARETSPTPPSASSSTERPAAVPGARFCTECGAGPVDGQRFCTNCGNPLAV